MSKSEFCILIPAIKKDVAFVDDLVKKLGGITLIERAINTALNVVSAEKIFVVTDSEEIALTCERRGIGFIRDPLFKIKTRGFFRQIKSFLLQKVVPFFESIALLSPYSPLIKSEEILRAVDSFNRSDKDLLVSIKKLNEVVFSGFIDENESIITGESGHRDFVQARSILLIKTAENILFSSLSELAMQPFELDSHCVEINSYQDWWICEKLLARKKIVFNVIGNNTVGMGHIFRSISVAHEISAHEVIFVCDKEADVAIQYLSRCRYPLEITRCDDLLERIISLKPDLVINDTLDTEVGFVRAIKAKGIKIVSFEDLGPGAEETDLTINDLYDQSNHPQLRGNIEWGPQNFFLRDEFTNAKVHRSPATRVEAILLAFGGTDANNLTMAIFRKIFPYCRENGIFIYIVSGSGYQHVEAFREYLSQIDQEGFEFIYCTGVMSKIMEKVQLAISSNGRTVYELAHMGIPGIVISHHEREDLHRFACEDNGFLNIGVLNGLETENNVLSELKRLVENPDALSQLFQQTLKHDFSMNKTKVIERIERLL